MTAIKLSKVSLPHVWTLEFESLHEAVLELRRHICSTCMSGGEWGHYDPLDIEFEGRTYICTDASELLSTGCGLEFEIEGAPEFHAYPDDIDPNMLRRISRRKQSPSDLMAA
ncbi:hypothetical protein [Rhizobium sp. BK176]|uniref:hypothetical protein n=1 Tax=Rhizobium sp. BK176 TaxID=2587071 RepID=UPI00216853E9|nr:hypothetical protein [Rhizobium sp. BK176]MCS4088498.1 hypothetical protein [Rhizobium sp. BK176]